MADKPDAYHVDINLSAQRDVAIGEFVGRDKIVNNIQNIIQRALSAAEEAVQEKSLEGQALAQGVSAFVQRLQTAAQDIQDGEAGSPYKGLLEYRLNDARKFFGRSQATRDLLQHISQGRLTVLHAESGAGKSSLLQASIMPRLISAGHLPIYLRPYNVEPSLVIKRALLADLSLTPLLATAPLRDFLRQVCDVLNTEGTDAGSQTRLYIFLDQFEEFFTQLAEPARNEFIRELAECLDDDGLNVRWILSMRAEFFGNLATFRPLVRSPFNNEYRLQRLTRAEASEVITAPAERHKLAFEAGLVDSLLNDLATAAGDVPPPQVQLVCSALYDGLKPGETTITRAQYNASGGAAGILRGHLERVLNRGLTAERRVIAQRSLEALVTADARRLIRTRSELLAELNAQHRLPIKAETLEAVLEQLVDSNLLRSQEAAREGGEQTYEAAPGLAYELAHDYLLEQIKVDPAVQARKAAQEMLDQEVRAYERYGTLLNADKLAILRAQEQNLVTSEAARALIRSSEQRLRRQQRLFAGSVTAAIGAALVAVVFLGLAVSAGRQQQIAVSTQRAAQTEAAAAGVERAAAVTAAQNAEVLRATSVAQAAAASTQEAIAQKNEAQARERELAAKQVVRNLFESEGLVPVGERPSAFALDGQGNLWVANAGKSSAESGSVQMIDVATGESTTPIAVGVEPVALAFDGARLWVANRGENSVVALDPATGLAEAPIPVGLEPSALEFDGTHLWVANQGEDTVSAIDPDTGQAALVVEVGFAPGALEFDGTRIWVANTEEDTVQFITVANGEVSLPIVVGAFPAALIYDGSQIWVANRAAGEIQPISPLTLQAGSPLLVDDIPTALAYDPAAQRLWVANLGSSTLQAVDLATQQVGPPIRVTGGPTALAMAGGRLWVASDENRVVRALDPLVGQLSAPIDVADFPFAAVYDGLNLWVSTMDANLVQVIDETSIRAALAAQSSGDLFDEFGEAAPGTTPAIEVAGIETASPGALVLDGQTLWVASVDEGTVTGFDIATGGASAPIPVGEEPAALALVGDQLWVANIGDNTVQVIDLVSGAASEPIPVDGGPAALAFDGARMWVANAYADSLQAIDVRTLEVVASIPVSGQPVALVHDGTRLWVASAREGQVHLVNPNTGQVEVTIRTGRRPTSLVYDGARVWVAHYWSNTIRALEYDAASGQAKAGAPIGVDIGPYGLHFDGTRLWIINSDSNTVQYLVLRR